jgi:hypothetical protein
VGGGDWFWTDVEGGDGFWTGVGTIDRAGALAGEGESRWEGIGLGKLPGIAEGVWICGDGLGTDAEAVRRLVLVRSSMGTGVARELGAGAVLIQRPFLSRGG